MEDETQSTPELDVARTEHERAMNDPSHPANAIFKSGDSDAINRWVEQNYRQAGVSGQVDVAAGLVIKPGDGGNPMPAQQADVGDAAVTKELEALGQDPKIVVAVAGPVMQALFPDEDSVIGHWVASRISELYGAKGEALAAKFLADLQALGNR